MFRFDQRLRARLGVKRWQCAMKQYSVWVGEWSAYWEDYRLQALPGGDHSAAADCLATLHLLRVMARTGEPDSDSSRLSR